MANAEKDPTSQVFEEVDDQETTVHQQEKQLHIQHAKNHSMMKKHHLEMMALVNQLYTHTAR